MPTLLERPTTDSYTSDDCADDEADISLAEILGEPAADSLDRPHIAELSARQIRRMSSGEIIDAIRTADMLHFCDAGRLEFLDRTVLERLMFLTRRCCRNQGY